MLILKIADGGITKTEVLEIPLLGSFCHLEHFTAHESDLSSGVILPLPLIRLGLLCFESEPAFPFFGPACTSLPPRLRTDSSYSKKPDILQQKLETFQLPSNIEVEVHRYDDSFPKGAIRRPDSAS